VEAEDCGDFVDYDGGVAPQYIIKVDQKGLAVRGLSGFFVDYKLVVWRGGAGSARFTLEERDEI
jgi:hypothetical protein